jgi:glycosyltransferase involved in cell wall biosynthesis
MAGLQVTVAQIGARRHYAVPAALDRAGMLCRFHTDWCASARSAELLRRIAPAALRGSRVQRAFGRTVPRVSRDRIVRHPRLLLAKVPRRRHRRYVEANEAFGRVVASHGFRGADAVYGFNAAALEIFRAAKRAGLLAVLDQTMVPWAFVERRLAEERRRWPGWDIDTPGESDWRRLAEREQEEWSLADLIVCGSRAVAEAVTNEGGPGSRCRVVPHGYNAEVEPARKTFDGQRPLRVLFVGTVELRKGVQYLNALARVLDRHVAEFRVVGPIRVSECAVRCLRSGMDLVGPVPRPSVAEHYGWADMLLLPTLAEGSANVCYEAMAHGLPVITTPSAGSVVRHGIDGWIVPERSVSVPAERVIQLASEPDTLETMSVEARQRALAYSFERYETELVAAVSSLRGGAIS